MQHHETKSFFERYQTFFSIIIAGLVIAGGIILSKTIPSSPSSGSATNPNGQPASQGEVKEQLLSVAKDLGLNKKSLNACLDGKTKEPVITAASELAAKSGVQGTPTFFILKRTFDAAGNVVDQKQIPVVGARDKATFLKAIADGKGPSDQPSMSGEKITLSEQDHYMGPRDAEIVLVEYSDIDCPFCKRAKPIIDELLTEHPEFAFVYRHAPLVQLHPFAAYKAQATECVAENAGEEGFWKFLDVVSK
jgi:protein-disulfide isomerase